MVRGTGTAGQSFVPVLCRRNPPQKYRVEKLCFLEGKNLEAEFVKERSYCPVYTF